MDAYGAIGDGTTDDSDAVQQAMNSGKSTVYFSKAAYKIGKPIDVPATVRCVNFLFGSPGQDSGWSRTASRSCFKTEFM